MMSDRTLALVIPVLNQPEMFRACYQSFKDTAAGWGDIEVLLIDNGSDVHLNWWGIEFDENVRVIRHETNTGVLAAHQEGYLETTAPWIFYTHSDVEMMEPGWDTKILQFIKAKNTAGLVGMVGFFGAKGLGTPELYQLPYVLTQLVRTDCVCGSAAMPAVHGHRQPRYCDRGIAYEQVAVLDGYAMIANRAFLGRQQGFDMNLPVHHMYDNHTCLQALDAGYTNWVIGVNAYHWGGQTSGTSDRWTEPFGMTPEEIHAKAHEYFYKYWAPTTKRRIQLPHRVP